MNVTVLDIPFPFSPATDRTPGLHLTDIIHDLLIDLNRYPGDEVKTEQMRITMERGFLWERMLELAWKDMLGVRVGEITRDGIIMSPDGHNIGGDRPWLEEYKATRKSSKHPITSNLAWMMQIKSYARALEVLECRMHVWYLNGDYAPQRDEYKVFQLEFTEAELQENWDIIMNHATLKGLI